MGFSNYADRAIRTATIACCRTHSRVAGNFDSGCTADRRTHYSSADTFHTQCDMDGSMRQSRSIRADTRADGPCD